MKIGFKNSICLLLCVFILSGALFSCASKAPAAQTTAESGEAPDPEGGDDQAPDKSFTVSGTPLEEFIIIYAESPFKKNEVKKFTTEYDFWRLIAEDISSRIEARTGVKLNVYKDGVEYAGHVIGVGPVSRPGCPDYIKDDIYESTVAVANGDLFVGGGYDGKSYVGGLKVTWCFASSFHAFDFVESAADGGKSDFEEGYFQKFTSHFTTVACVGDSITEGYGSTLWTTNDYHSYPSVLSRILWKDYVVINYGNSGKTMRSDLGGAYTSTPQYGAAWRKAKSFDYILLMLGTNDSEFDRDWDDADDKKYNDSALTIVTRLTRNETVETVVMNCPAYYGTGGSGSARVRGLQDKLPALLEQNGFKASFFDMHALTDGKVGRANFPDLLHPNDKGYAIMAEGLAQMLLERAESQEQ